MLLTLLTQPSLVFGTISMTLLFIIQAVQTSPTGSIIEYAITNGSIGAILFLVWYLTFKFALKQNQEQFEKALLQIEKQHKDNLDMNQKTIDRLLDMMRRENEYKEILTGVLTDMKNALITIQHNKGGN